MTAEKGPEAARTPGQTAGPERGEARYSLVGLVGAHAAPGTRRVGGEAGRGSPELSGSAPSRRGGPGEGRGSGAPGAVLRDPLSGRAPAVFGRSPSPHAVRTDGSCRPP